MNKISDYEHNPNEIIYAFIKLLQKNREAQNLSVRELGEKAGVSYTVIYDLEKRNILPKIETINKIANALGLSINIHWQIIESFPALAVFYCKKGHEIEMFAKMKIPVTRKSSNIISDEQLESYLIKQGLYQQDIEEINNFIKFKLSQHKK